MESEQHDVVGERTTREPSARAARHEADASLGEHAHDGNRLVARAREDRERWPLLVAGQSIGFVGSQLPGAFEHPSLSDDRGKRAREPVVGADHAARTGR